MERTTGEKKCPLHSNFSTFPKDDTSKENRIIGLVREDSVYDRHHRDDDHQGTTRQKKRQGKDRRESEGPSGNHTAGAYVDRNTTLVSPIVSASFTR